MASLSNYIYKVKYEKEDIERCPDIVVAISRLYSPVQASGYL